MPQSILRVRRYRTGNLLSNAQISVRIPSRPALLQVSVLSGPRNQIPLNDNDVLPPLNLEGGIAYS